LTKKPTIDRKCHQKYQIIKNGIYSDKNIWFSLRAFYLCGVIHLNPSLSKATLIRLTGSILIGRTQKEPKPLVFSSICIRPYFFREKAVWLLAFYATLLYLCVR